MDLIKLERRVEELETKFERIIRVGIVTSVSGGKVRVKIKDVSSHELPVLFPKTQHDKFQAMPDINEQVLCIFLPFDETQGFVLGSMYSDTDPAPVSGSEKAHITFKDGSVLEYDRSAKKLLMDLSGASGDIEIMCKNADITATEDVSVTAKNSNVTVSENAVLNAKNATITVEEKTELTSNTEVTVTSPLIKFGEGAENNCVHSNDPCPLGLKHTGSSIVKVAP